MSELRAARSRAALVLVLVVLPLWLRLAPADHGHGRVYVPDTHMVRQALGMARDRDPFPPVGRYSTYPYLGSYLLLPVYATEYALGRLAGRWESAQEFGARAMLDPWLVHYPARLLVAVLGALTAWVVYRAARAAALGRGAVVAGFLVATGLLHVQLSTQERPWVPMLFFGALAMGAAVRYGDGARRGWLVASGAAAGLSVACHQAGAVMLGLAGLAWLLGPLGWRGRALARRLGEGVLCLVAFLVAALALGHSYYLVHGATPRGAVSGGAAAESLVKIGGQAIRLEVSLASLKHLSRAFLGYDPALLLLALVGLGPALRHPRLRPLAAFALAYAAFFMTNVNDHVRYLLPLTVLLAPAAGLAAELLWERRAGRLAVVLACSLALVQASRLGWLLERPDTRAEGERLLAELPAGAVVAIDHYGPVVDLSLPALTRLAGLRELRTREAKRFELLRQGALQDDGVDALYVEELFGVDPESGAYGLRPEWRGRWADERSALAEMGVTHLMVTDRRPGDGHRPYLLDFAAHQTSEPSAERDRVVDPSRGPRRAREALLPTDMDFPLFGLWSVDRPGPLLELARARL